MSNFLRLLNKRATVKRSETNASDGMGGWTRSPSESWEEVPCRIQPASARERESAGRQQVRHDYNIWFESDVDLKRGDDVTVGDLTLHIEMTMRPSVSKYLKATASVSEDGPS